MSVQILTMVETPTDPEAHWRVVSVEKASQRMFNQIMEGVCPSCESDVDAYEFDDDSYAPRWGVCNGCGWADRFRAHAQSDTLVIYRVVAN